MTKSSQSSSCQPPVSQFVEFKPTKWSTSDPRQKECEDYLINFVAEDLQALSVVDSISFREYSAKLNPKFTIPYRKILSNRLIPQKKAALHNSIKSRLKGIDSVCVTLDIWTNRDMRSYLGITCHFINNYKLASAMLACTQFRGRHTADSIVEKYEEVTSSFELGGKVKVIVTDNASNMKKAFLTLPGMEKITTDSDSEEESQISDIDTDLLT